MIFFVISGYCIAAAAHRAIEQRTGVATFLARRFRRIFPPWWAAMVLWLALGAWRSAMHASAWSWLTNLTLTHWTHLLVEPKHVASKNTAAFLSISWTLCYEEQFYALACLLVALAIASRRCSRHVLPVGMSLLCMAGVAWNLTHPRMCFGPFTDYIAHFSVGFVLFARLCLIRTQRSAMLIDAILIMCLVVVITTMRIHYPDVPMLADDVLRTRLVFREWWVVLATALVFIAMRRFDRSWQNLRVLRVPLAALGAMSYSLYLTHMPIAHAVERWNAARAVPFSHHQLAVPVLLLELAVAALFWCLVERHFVGTRKPLTAPRALA